jgi:hypothetical protein
MKPILNNPTHIVPTTGIDRCNHAPYCKGDRICPACGRKMCNECTSRNGGGRCMICSGRYHYDEIKLLDD